MRKSLNLAERTGLGSSRIPLKMGARSRCSAVNALYRFPPKGWLRPLSFRLFDWIRQRRALPDVRIEALSWFIQHPVLEAGLRHSGIEQLIAFPAAILGGLDSTAGAIVGGVVVGLTEALSAQCISFEFSKSAVFLVMLLVLVVRPSGLFGTRELSRV